MYTAYSTIMTTDGPKTVKVSQDPSWARLLYDLVNYWGVTVDPEPVSIYFNTIHFAFTSYGHWTSEGRDVRILYADGRYERYTIDLRTEETWCYTPVGT